MDGVAILLTLLLATISVMIIICVGLVTQVILKMNRVEKSARTIIHQLDDVGNDLVLVRGVVEILSNVVSSIRKKRQQKHQAKVSDEQK